MDSSKAVPPVAAIVMWENGAPSVFAPSGECLDPSPEWESLFDGEDRFFNDEAASFNFAYVHPDLDNDTRERIVASLRTILGDTRVYESSPTHFTGAAVVVDSVCGIPMVARHGPPNAVTCSACLAWMRTHDMAATR